MSMMRDDLIATYASILHEEREVVFHIKDVGTIGVITENVSGDGDWNVDVMWQSEDMDAYQSKDGGWCDGNAKEAIEFVISMHEDLENRGGE